VSLEGENPNIATQVRSAVLSNRINAKKIKYYRLDLTIGTLKFTNHPLFCEEDHLAVSLQKQFRQYEERVGLCLIDHLQ
jgi:hypothetical protein